MAAPIPWMPRRIRDPVVAFEGQCVVCDMFAKVAQVEYEGIAMCLCSQCCEELACDVFYVEPPRGSSAVVSELPKGG